MKKSLFLFVLLFCYVSVFADTKIYVGGCTFIEVFSQKEDYTKSTGLSYLLGGNIKMNSSYKYFDNKANFVFNPKYPHLHVDNDLKLKWNVFYIGSYFDYTTLISKKEMCKYTDICLGLNFNKDIFSWLTVGGDFKLGYVPLNIIGEYNNSNNFITALKLNINIKEYIHFYCGVECIESKKDYIFFCPLTVKNCIGVNIEYFWNRMGVYASADYYCLHPEHAYQWEMTKLNQNRFVGSVGVALKL